VKEGESGANSSRMYVNGKITYVEIIPGIGVGGMRRIVERLNSSVIYLIYCKKFYKCHNVHPPTTTLKINK
jgi:hypothetical protein